ncbi:MAG TPA: CADD family putative folate metabolism protein [Actinomycetota bacterium]|nr:CADD family putative folate metabolism protein [Actinomycetota bacterium]
MDVLGRIDEAIGRRDLLTHSFYTKWVDGTLPTECLQEYARQYHAFESAFPTFLSALHSRCNDRSTRQALLENLWDEEHGPNNHRELWLRFAEGIGVSREDVESAEPNPATRALLDTYERATREAPVAAGVAAVYAYEAQVPRVAHAKTQGLREHYGIDGGPAAEFFEVHGELDVEHSAAERHIVAQAPADEAEEIVEATAEALDAWWNFLTAVDVPVPAPVG